jgi:hypothetical protein
MAKMGVFWLEMQEKWAKMDEKWAKTELFWWDAIFFFFFGDFFWEIGEWGLEREQLRGIIGNFCGFICEKWRKRHFFASLEVEKWVKMDEKWGKTPQNDIFAFFFL